MLSAPGKSRSVSLADLNVTAEDRQTRDSNRDTNPTADAQAAFKAPTADAVLIYLDARLGNSSEVESRMTQLLIDADASPRSMELLIALNERLKNIGSNLDITRQKILEFVVSKISVGHELADRSLEELGAVYTLLGRTDQAHGILNRRVQRLLTTQEPTACKRCEIDPQAASGWREDPALRISH